MTAVLEFVDAAAEVLASHASYTWNKSATRIRCNGTDCGAILDVPGGEDEAVTAFSRHQAEQLPTPAEPEPLVVSAPAPEPGAPSAEVLSVQAVLPSGPAPETPVESDTRESTTAPAGEEPMEQVLSEAALAVADQAPAPKIRRDTKTLTATIAEINKGDRVSATFNHPRYGIFTVEGTVTKGGTGQDRNQLMVAGWYINLNGRAAKYLFGLQIIAPAGKHEFAIPKPSELTEHVGIGG